MGIVKGIGGAAYMDGHKASGIKVGDRVRITRKASRCERGWNNTWTPVMDAAVGSEGTVLFDWDVSGFRVDVGKFPLSYPYFVLEKVTEPAKHPIATVSRNGYTITIQCDDETTVQELDRIIGKVEEVIGESETEPRAKVGDWVRRISPPSEPGQVTSVGTRGLQTGGVSDDDARFMVGFGYADHGNYEIVRKVVTPWTMKDACEALAKHDMTLFWGDAIYRVSLIGSDRIRFESPITSPVKSAWDTSFWKSYEELADQSKNCLERFSLPGGTPCGNVTWEVVQ